MKVLMISIDRGLLGRGQLGDVVERHKKYGEFIDKLDIIVFCQKGFELHKISEKVTAYPTNSASKSRYFFDAKRIGQELFQQNKYDLVVTQEPFLTGLVGYKLKKKFGSKLLVHFHGDFWQNINWLKENKLNWLFLLISKFVVAKADGVRLMSEGQREKLGKYKEKARVISTPVDLSKFMEHGTWNMEQLENAKGDLKIVLHVGRDDKVKDYDTLVRAFKLVKERNPSAIFWQAGANKEIEEAMKKNSFFDIAVIGFKDDKALLSLFTRSAVFALSSTSESFGKVLVEANACGKPVVSTATTGAKEIIQDGYNGYLVPIGDAKALAEKILYLLNNPEKAKEMGENGRKLVKEKFSDNTEKIINFWQDIIENKL